jgi:hypothetical protein
LILCKKYNQLYQEISHSFWKVIPQYLINHNFNTILNNTLYNQTFHYNNNNKCFIIKVNTELVNLFKVNGDNLHNNQDSLYHNKWTLNNHILTLLNNISKFLKDKNNFTIHTKINQKLINQRLSYRNQNKKWKMNQQLPKNY